ncbi:hypothetical protein JIG36_11915 [Actinoplanes sp. LDG1-06]|uniref:Uncharacterized protein n=1 Tax=Paractinoplanes ovalisporus TaxID=2810368 RepID=A0ABS2A8U5_9ACTN|nr:hypothetical protein [Actinoplanes ovalisporus]MBM2616263.1 hypothetical protein [Actinoplanes ovalisporus]
MRTVVITGGTRGIGGALAARLRRRGDRVVALGSADADLSSPRQTVELAERLPGRIDVLVLAAGRFDQRRVVTADGLEQSFAISVLSRHLLVERLVPRMRGGTVLSLCGVGGLPFGRLNWDDLQLERRYSLTRATMQGARALDLLGAGFADRHPDRDVRYVLWNPLLVDSGMHRYLRQPWRTVVGRTAALLGEKPGAAAERLERLLDRPLPAGLTAFRRGRPVPVDGPGFDPGSARRLAERLDRAGAEHWG